MIDIEAINFYEHMDNFQGYRNALKEIHDSRCGLLDVLDQFITSVNPFFDHVATHGNRYHIILKPNTTIDNVRDELDGLIQDSSPFGPYSKLIYKTQSIPCEPEGYYIIIKRKA